MSRRFLNLVLNCYRGLYSVHHLDTSHLFYKSAAAAAAVEKRNANKRESMAASEKKKSNKKENSIWGVPIIRRLPVSSFNFQSFRSKNSNISRGADLFGPFGKTKVLCADCLGQTAVYDTRSHISHLMPEMNSPKGPMHIALRIPGTAAHATSTAASDSDSDPSIESFIFQQDNGSHSESLYIMDMVPNRPSPFEVLSFTSNGWLWRPLPPPPFLSEPGYKPRSDLGAAVNGNAIFISPSTDQDKGIGTYSFDTVTQQWFKSGERLLPFLGKAEYDPGLRHWFGFTPDSPYHFCAINSLYPPKVRRVWADFDPPESWSLLDLYLVNLGFGRFCIAKGFDASDDSSDEGNDDDYSFETEFVFIGVEVVRCSDQPGGLKMIKHKSKCITNLDIRCVL